MNIPRRPFRYLWLTNGFSVLRRFFSTLVIILTHRSPIHVIILTCRFPDLDPNPRSDDHRPDLRMV